MTAGKWVKRGSKASRVKADGEVRRSQAIRTYGAGSLMDLVDRSALIGGLDFWHFGTEGSTEVQEPRLRDTIARMLAGVDGSTELSADRAFLLPPAGIDGEPQRNCGVEVFEFPQWFVCQAPRCRALVRAPQGLELKGERWQHYCDAGQYSPAVPVRFVMACKNGHLDEVPWVWFVHEGQDVARCASPRLTLIEGKTGDFSEVAVRCACGAGRRLAHALSTEANPNCQGHRPWLGPEAQEECEHRPRLLMRGASNTYFSQVVSALSIPESDSPLAETVRGLMDVLMGATAENLPTLRAAIPKLAALGDAGDAEVMEASERIYCAPRDRDVPMAAVLISTGTPGTEGTLGGLVEQGKQILAHLQRAYDMGRLCSNDPVCAYHTPAKDPTRRYREGAACHGCLYVAEPSCERFNCYLDRALVVPTMGHPRALAFFSERPSLAPGDGARRG